ncbi:MAG TPA: class I SAM-dependent methyltransferase [Saprospiraceae bacterium]|nr:class I SAM-dependent methyltransferase [Saprospiraceae bacterium]MCB9268187.1 class I SAM-dependent methyltransferase [Lewinellaceae bacterium]HPG09636.1 class I SAM-dependent methyltransferase [Saprospiraceae bacterium]HRV86975.1 class I SAM-dependent methyltransferase [Saprospiraceae bacterium]
MNQDLSTYYNDRAREYDKVYEIPDEQEDLIKSAVLFQNIFADKSVLEIACGTGYWTEKISKTANSIFATDINEIVIDIARTRKFNSNVVFQVADMNCLSIDKKFDGLFGGFIWSHILLQDLDNFLLRLKDLLNENAKIAFIDSKQVEGTNHDRKRITRIDQYGNTFQTRTLENGTTHEVLKNFPSKQFLTDKLLQISTEVEIIELEHYWIATSKTNGEKIRK